MSRENDLVGTTRADRNPNTQGCLDLGMGRDDLESLLGACREGAVAVLVLQGPELLRDPALSSAVDTVPFVVVMAAHEGPELAKAHAVLPAGVWAESDGTFTNYARRVQRFRRAVPPPGEARPRWQLSLELLRRLETPLPASSARELFGLLAVETAGYGSLSHRLLGDTGRALASDAEPSGVEA